MDTKELFANGYALIKPHLGEYTFWRGLGRWKEEVTLPVGVVPVTFVGEQFCARWDAVQRAKAEGLAL